MGEKHRFLKREALPYPRPLPPGRPISIFCLYDSSVFTFHWRSDLHDAYWSVAVFFMFCRKARLRCIYIFTCYRGTRDPIDIVSIAHITRIVSTPHASQQMGAGLHRRLFIYTGSIPKRSVTEAVAPSVIFTTFTVTVSPSATATSRSPSACASSSTAP